MNFAVPRSRFEIPKAIFEDSLREVLTAETFFFGSHYLNLIAESKRMFESPHVIPVGSCALGLLAILKTLNIGPGCEVITVPNTSALFANIILQSGADLVFCDIDSRSFCMDSLSLAEQIGPRTKAIIPVHLYGIRQTCGKSQK